MPAEVRRIRKRLHLTQQQFAELLRVSLPSVQNWEAGRNFPHTGTLRRIRGLAVPEGAITGARISQETRDQLIAALELILERAPSPIIEDMARYLTDRAGKYGG